MNLMASSFNTPKPGKLIHLFLWVVLLSLFHWIQPPQSKAQINPAPSSINPSPLSPNSPLNRPQGEKNLIPYNNGYLELDLWRLEERKFLRSRSVLSPDNEKMIYSEVTYMPDKRQTFSALYLVNFNTLPSNIQKQDPNQSLQQRIKLVALGQDASVPYEFRTLTPIDWSFSGKRFLFKQKSGIIHVGLKTSDILVYDEQRGSVTLYSEIQRALRNYWKEVGIIPDLDTLAWDIYPLGWEPGSDSIIVFKGWAFDKTNRKFLGIWRYDIDNERSELISLKDARV
ncbi:MAG: hypothetical protein K2X66_08115, partial [Cyanobacteria bacterium]|nr:hypothetical protein [Cyanobacteriota bacterium]